MNDWIKFIDNKNAITSVYGNNIPEISDVNIHELSIHRDGPRIAARFDLATFPSNPPQKWKLYNTVQLVLNFCNFYNLHIDGWGVDLNSRIDISNHNDDLNVCIKNKDMESSFACNYIYIQRISAYCKG